MTEEVASLQRELTFDSFMFLVLCRFTYGFFSLSLVCVYVMIWQSVGLQSVFRASEVFRLCCWCGISCDEMVSPISTVTHCGLEFCTKQPLVQTDIVCWMGALVCFMLSYFSLSAPLFLSLSFPISLIFYLSLFTLKLLNNLYCSVVEYALVAWINRDDVHAASRINNRQTCFHTKQEKKRRRQQPRMEKTFSFILSTHNIGRYTKRSSIMTESSHRFASNCRQCCVYYLNCSWIKTRTIPLDRIIRADVLFNGNQRRPQLGKYSTFGLESQLILNKVISWNGNGTIYKKNNIQRGNRPIPNFIQSASKALMFGRYVCTLPQRLVNSFKR